MCMLSRWKQNTAAAAVVVWTIVAGENRTAAEVVAAGVELAAGSKSG